MNTLLPVSLNDSTCMITETVSNTNKPPMIPKTTSCLAIILTAPNDPPNDSEPVSHIKILAGGALNHKKPRHAPTIDPQKIEASPTFKIYGICK